MIVYSSTPSNNTTSSNTAVYQEWGPVPNETHVYYSPNGTSTILANIVNIKIKDFIGVPGYSSYTQFKVCCLQYYEQGDAEPIKYLKPESLLGMPSPDGDPYTENGIAFTFEPVFRNLNLLPYGIKTYTHLFFVKGKSSTGTWTWVGYYYHYLKLHIVETLVTYTPQLFALQHVQNTFPASKEITIIGDSWRLIGNPKVILSSIDPAVTISTPSNPDTQVADGTGTAIVKATLSGYYDQDIAFSYYDLNQELYLKVGETIAGIIKYSITLVNQHTFSSNPTILNFMAVKGIDEPVSKNISFSCIAPVTISCSPWLSAEIQTVDSGGVVAEVIVVKPIGTSNMDAGQYTGFVRLDAIVNGVASSRNTIVNYDLQGFVAIEYENGLAFTLDQKYYNFATTNIDSYIQFNVSARIYNFIDDTYNLYTIPNKIALFKGKGKFNLGMIVHKLMARFQVPTENVLQYKPAQIEILCQEKSLLDESILRSANFPQKFIAGLGSGIQEYGMLEFNTQPSRVTKSGFYYLNMLVPPGKNELIIYKNNAVDTVEQLPFIESTIIMKKIMFEEFEPGDVIVARLRKENTEAEGSPSKTFHVLPEGKYSNFIVWENEYLLESNIECTGDFSFSYDLSFQSQNLYKDMVQQLELLDSTRTAKLTVNTGWLLKSDVESIESLMRCRRAWFMYQDKVIKIRPLPKNIVALDSEKELIEYTLEFQINPNYEQETYTS